MKQPGDSVQVRLSGEWLEAEMLIMSPDRLAFLGRIDDDILSFICIEGAWEARGRVCAA